MNSEHIYTLLNKYWNCETSTEEERALRDYFSNPKVPAELERYAPLFAHINEERSILPDENFDDELRATILAGGRRRQYITIRIFTPMLRIVASLFLVIGLGVSLFFISRQENKPHFAETYHDPNAAIKDATYALTKISDALQTSEKASLQTLQFIDELEIDWSSLDSLSNTLQIMMEKDPLEGDMIEGEDAPETTEMEKEMDKLF